MKFEMLVGLFVKDDEMYQKYREKMKPILESYGGGFSSDFKIAEVLKKPSEELINRVFTIYFKDENSKDQFFSNEEYLKIKERYYNPSVQSATLISEYIVTDIK